MFGPPFLCLEKLLTGRTGSKDHLTQRPQRAQRKTRPLGQEEQDVKFGQQSVKRCKGRMTKAEGIQFC